MSKLPTMWPLNTERMTQNDRLEHSDNILWIIYCILSAIQFNNNKHIDVLACPKFLFSRLWTRPVRPAPADTQIISDYDILPLHVVVSMWRPLSARHVRSTAYFDSLPLMRFPFNSISAHSSTPSYLLPMPLPSGTYWIYWFVTFVLAAVFFVVLIRSMHLHCFRALAIEWHTKW